MEVENVYSRVLERLKESNIKAVHENTGIHFNTLHRIKNGKDLLVKTLIKLEEHFFKK